MREVRETCGESSVSNTRKKYLCGRTSLTFRTNIRSHDVITPPLVAIRLDTDSYLSFDCEFLSQILLAFILNNHSCRTSLHFRLVELTP